MRIGAKPSGFLLFAGRRALETGVVLSLALLISFFMARLIPGSPLEMMADSQAVDVESVQRLRAVVGLDLPLWRQFLEYGAGVLRGDFGLSWRYSGVPVQTLIRDAAPITLHLTVAAVMVAAPMGLAAGLLSAFRPGRGLDVVITVGAVCALSCSPVVLATWVMMAFSTFQMLPASGEPATLLDFLAPVLSLALPPAGIIARVTRSHLLETLGQDYIACARAKGLSPWAVLLRHALPNALVAVVTVVGSVAGSIFTTSAVVETVFNLPGLGRLAIDAVLNRDYALIAATILIFVLVQVAVSLIVDVLSVAIDPRLHQASDNP
jgi:ABC-type dipeptide/oligopeptide/nickel transport system permease component